LNAGRDRSQKHKARWEGGVVSQIFLTRSSVEIENIKDKKRQEERSQKDEGETGRNENAEKCHISN
jgi:hypothetical protein